MCWFLKDDSKVIKFLFHLTTSDEARERYRHDPIAEMVSYGLTEEERTLLLTEDKNELVQSLFRNAKR